MKKRSLISALLSCAVMCSAVHIDAAEITTRGLVAMKTDNGIYLSWRLHKNEDNIFGTASDNTSFKIYKNNVLLDENEDNTNYIDKTGKSTDKYYVVDEKGNKSETVTAFSSGSNYFDINLTKPADVTLADGVKYSYTPGDTSCGDLDGDGEYELVIMWECNPQDNSRSGYTGNVLIDAYKLDGTRLWNDYIDLGCNIRNGAHYAQFLVYDFDTDGKAEITCQTAPGSKDAKDKYVTEASRVDAIKNATDNTVSNVNTEGRILSGDEYFTIFSGNTGEAIDTIYYPNQRVAVDIWGDDYGNRCDRYTAAVAYLDGEKPYAVYMRGYYFDSKDTYGRQTACAITFNGEKLECKHSFDTYNTENYSSKSSSVSYNNGVYKGVTGYESGHEKYVGNGNHNCSVADMNGDGKDEVVTGALCYYLSDGKLKPMWCTYKGHGDAIHIGKYDPTNPNFDIFVIHEEGGWTDKLSGNNVVLDFGYSVINSENGNIKFHKSASSDTGRGMMANVGMGGYYQVWASNGLGRPYSSYGNGLFLQPDESLTEEPKFRIFWDGDLYDELLYKTWIDSWDDDSRSMQKIFETTGCSPVSGTTPALQADILGDWREEVCYPTTDGTKLRVYTTDIYTDYKIMSLMNDRTYECGVIAQQTAYNQPPHIGFYLDEGVLKGGIEKLTIDSLPDKTKYSTRESVDIDGLKVKAQYADGTSGYITGYSITGLDTSTEGNKTVTISSGGKSATFGITVETPTGSVLLSDPENMAPSNQKNLQFGGTETEGNVYGKIDGAYKLSNSVATVSNGSQGFYTDADIFGSINVAMDTDSTAILHFGKSGPGTHYQALSFKAGGADADETISVVAGEKNRTSTVTMTLRPQTWYNVEYYVNRAEYKGYITVTDIVNNKVVLTANTINPWGAYCTTNLYWNSGGSTGDVYIANSWLYSKPCGSITADTDNVTLSNVPTRVGESLNVTVTPKDGYTLKSVTYNGTTVEATDNTASVTVKGSEDAQTLSISLEGITQPTPTVAPTATPTVKPTVAPTATPTTAPTAKPTATPALTPMPTTAPTLMPTVVPTVVPTSTPTPDESEKEYLEVENNFKDTVTIEKMHAENGDVVLTITSAEEMEFNFYTAVYDSDSVLKKVSITPCEMVDGKTILTVTKPEIADNETYKLMLWTDGQTPVIKAISSAVQSFFR